MTTRPMAHPTGLALAGPVVILVASWASTFAAIKVGLAYSPPLLFAGMRALLGGAAMALLAWRSGQRLALGATWRAYVGLAVLNVVLFFGLQTYALQYLPSGMSAVLIYLQPVLVGLLAWPLLGEHLSVSKLLGLVIGFCGIVTVSASSLQGDIPMHGVVLALVGALTWALGTIYLKRTQHLVAHAWAVTAQFLIGGTVLSVLGLIVDGPGSVSWTPAMWAAIGYAGLIGTALAWAVWTWLIRVGQASRAAAYIFFVPPSAIVIGAVLFDEPVTPLLAIGAGLVVAGIWVVNRRPT